MRHKVKGRKLGRNSSHRKAMFRNMAVSLIHTLRPDEDAENTVKIAGRIVTTVHKAKELRPFVEKLITLAKKSLPHQEQATQFATQADRNSAEWKSWKESDQWQKWSAAISPAVTARRRAFDILRDKKAVEILFSDLAEKFKEREGGYTRIVELATPRLGDNGRQALIEFVGERDRVKTRTAPAVVASTAPAEQSTPEPAATTTDEASSEPSEESGES